MLIFWLIALQFCMTGIGLIMCCLYLALYLTIKKRVKILLKIGVVMMSVQAFVLALMALLAFLEGFSLLN